MPEKNSVERALRSDTRKRADRVIRGAPPLAAAEALRLLQRRGEAQLAQSSPTAVWRKPATP